MRTLKLYATGAATANGAASVVIPSSSTIRGVQVSCRFDSIVDNSACDLEVSRASASEIAVNGAQQSIVQVGYNSNFVTSGLSAPNINVFFPVNVSVVQGQIIYLHALVATVTYVGTFIIHYD